MTRLPVFSCFVKTEREGFCFFLPYHPGMLDPAAVELEKRRAAAKEAGEDRKLTQHSLKLTQHSLKIAVIALVVQTFFSVASLVASSLKP
jgi:hypothetical protein